MNFDLHSGRPLTADEARAVEIAKKHFRDSFMRNNNPVAAAAAVFKPKILEQPDA